MKKQLALIYLVLIVASVIGWAMNIIAIAHTNFNNVTGMLVLRVIGIFVAPLGAVLGYI
jgi:hypothetical protein